MIEFEMHAQFPPNKWISSNTIFLFKQITRLQKPLSYNSEKIFFKNEKEGMETMFFCFVLNEHIRRPYHKQTYFSVLNHFTPCIHHNDPLPTTTPRKY